MTPADFAPCVATVTRIEALVQRWDCVARPPTPKARERTWTRWHDRNSNPYTTTIPLSDVNVVVHIQPKGLAGDDSITGRAEISVRLRRGHMPTLFQSVAAHPLDTLPDRLHAAALGLVRAHIDVLDKAITAKAIALEEDQAARDALAAILPQEPAHVVP